MTEQFLAFLLNLFQIALSRDFCGQFVCQRILVMVTEGVSDHTRGNVLSLQKLVNPSEHEYVEPLKKINVAEDVQFFLTSRAYKDIVTWILMLNASMFPRKDDSGKTHTWPIGMPAKNLSPMVTSLRSMLHDLDQMLEKYPPDTGPRRFGNVAFRDWYAGLEANVDDLLKKCLPKQIQADASQGPSPLVELRAYLLGGWGSPQRLDYGTGHELSFLAFLACLWKLGTFAKSEEGTEERSIVLYVVQPYLQLVRRLIKIYTLEPAGSHGVWGLDDHSFVPYIFGSAQYSPAIFYSSHIPTEGSVRGAPDPTSVTKPTIVEQRRETNMYFDAIGFIYDVKKGPFWEHSPVLYDISGVKAGWAKINKGMIKMYLAEVLAKFPVVQHFPFGSLFLWERDPEAKDPPTSMHTDTHVSRTAPSNGPGTAAPWAGNATSRVPVTPAVAGRTALPIRHSNDTSAIANGNAAMPAPWSSRHDTTNPDARGTNAANISLTKAPWAK